MDELLQLAREHGIWLVIALAEARIIWVQMVRHAAKIEALLREQIESTASATAALTDATRVIRAANQRAAVEQEIASRTRGGD